MDKFYESLKELLKDCEQLLKPGEVISSKWVVLNTTQQAVKEEKNEKLGLSNSYARAISQISKLASYQTCQKLFENDEVFKEAINLAGYWGTFRSVFQDVIHNCGQMRKNKVIMNEERAIQHVDKIREEFAVSEVYFTSSARLLGVNLKCKEIALPDGASLYRLNRKEINEQQPNIEPYSSNRESTLVAFHPTELRMTLKVPVDRSQKSAFFQADNEAQKIARNVFNQVLDAILLLKDGQIDLSPQRFEGGPIGGITTTGSYPTFIPILNVNINKEDIPKIVKAYEFVGGKSAESDKVITRALHRFLLGRKRRDLVDKLIDFVISWESLLLTQEGNPATNELIYRFSINGSSFIATISKSKNRRKYFKMMKSIYALRSDIVHGGDDKKIEKNLKASEFGSLDEVCKFLDGHFKAAIWWLTSIAPQKRPYMKKDGWEELLWP